MAWLMICVSARATHHRAHPGAPAWRTAWPDTRPAPLAPGLEHKIGKVRSRCGSHNEPRPFSWVHGMAGDEWACKEPL